MRILLIEDSDRLQRYVAMGLRQAGFTVDSTPDGVEGLRLAMSNDYDGIVLDLMIPGLDGLSLLDRLRRAGRDTPVLILTSRDTVDDRVRGLEQGADDYLVKPFALEELAARLRALQRRRYGRKTSQIKCGAMVIDLAGCSVTWNGNPVDMTRREYLLLEYLAARSGQTVSRTEIEEHIYDRNATLMSNVVDSTICALRRKFEALGADAIIQTRRGLGYALLSESA